MSSRFDSVLRDLIYNLYASRCTHSLVQVSYERSKL